MGLLLWDMQKKYPGWSATYSKHYIVCIVHVILNKPKEKNQSDNMKDMLQVMHN